MLRHSLTNVLSNSGRKWRRRAHTRTRAMDFPGPFFALGGARGVLGRRKVESTRDHHAHRGRREATDRLCHSCRHPLGREGEREEDGKMPPLVPSFIPFPFPRPVSTSCRPRKVGKYFLLALFPGPTTTAATATADFHVPPERRERESG